MLSKNNLTLLHLLLIPGVGPATVFKILKLLNTTPNLDLSLLYSKTSSWFKFEVGLSENIVHAICSGLANQKILADEVELIQKNNVAIITILDEAYPKDLANSYLPPTVLYCTGLPLSSYEKKIAIVGSRKAGVYSERVLEKFTPALIENNWTIVSGGALGVDTMAHESAIEFGGKTIAVLGSGLLELYPSENKKLFFKIESGFGTLVSIFPLTTKPFKNNFPARNRVISGLSSGCLVVQAAQKSGALITAKYALDHGRQVFAVPGSIFDELSIGCHELILDGAKVVFNVQHLLEEFGEHSIEKVNNVSNVTIEKNINSPKINDPLVDALAEAMSIDELSLALSVEVSFLHEKLFELQLEGKVEQGFTGLWKRI